MGTNTGDMISRCRNAGLPDPRPESRPESRLESNQISNKEDGDNVDTIKPESVSKPESRLESNAKFGEIAADIGPKPESHPESRLEINEQNGEVDPEPESLEMKVLRILRGTLLSKSAISRKIGLKEISGRLKAVIIVMLADKTIEYTLPDKPNSRMQQYRLMEKGEKLLSSQRKSSEP